LGRRGLSRKELKRVDVMGRVKVRSVRLREAAELLELSYRPAKQIWARYRDGGAKALQHGNCGRVSNRAYTAKFLAAVLQQVKARYEDFLPTLAAEQSQRLRRGVIDHVHQTAARPAFFQPLLKAAVPLH